VRTVAGAETAEARGILLQYLGVVLKHIQDAIIWESGLESAILVSVVDDVSGWCEVQERLKWFTSESDKLIVGTLGVALPKEKRKELKKKIKELHELASKYYEELGQNLKHKCTLSQLQEDHIDECRAQLKKTIDFILENKTRVSGDSPTEIADAFEAQMFALLEEIAGMETASYNTPEERKVYKDKSVEVRKKIATLMKEVSDFKAEILEMPDAASMTHITNRLEDLQENLADLSHDFSKALELAKRDGLGGVIKEKQVDNARKVHEQHAEDMFQL